MGDRRALIATVAALLAAPAAEAARGGIDVVGKRRLSDRLTDLTFRSDLLSQRTHARVLLPRGYARSTRRYPVLYLLHGAVDDYRSWTLKGDAEKLTAGLPLIVVMPDTGPPGWYTDWLRGEPLGDLPHLPAGSVGGPFLPHGRAPRRPGAGGALDGRVRRDELRRPPPGRVLGRGRASPAPSTRSTPRSRP